MLDLSESMRRLLLEPQLFSGAGLEGQQNEKRGQGGTKGGYIESYYIRSCPEYDPEPKRDIPEEKGGQRLKYNIDKVMLLTRAGMTEAQAGGRFMSRSAEDQV